MGWIGKATPDGAGGFDIYVGSAGRSGSGCGAFMIVFAGVLLFGGVPDMRAATLTTLGHPLTVHDVPDPRAGGGEVLVEVLATSVPPYANEVFSGERRYPIELPIIPGVGGVGRVVSAGPDATKLKAGDLVWCDSTVRARDDALTPDIALQGWSSRGEGGARLARHLHDGAFAELMRVPTENAYPLPVTADPVRWSALTAYTIPYGGLLVGALEAGETLLVSGATGNLGSTAVAVALAMGAGHVVAPAATAPPWTCSPTASARECHRSS